MNTELILKYYKSRLQIEFFYRDTKQHTSLTNCQARSKNKLNFPINVAKILHWLVLPKEKFFT